MSDTALYEGPVPKPNLLTVDLDPRAIENGSNTAFNGWAVIGASVVRAEIARTSPVLTEKVFPRQRRRMRAVPEGWGEELLPSCRRDSRSAGELCRRSDTSLRAYNRLQRLRHVCEHLPHCPMLHGLVYGLVMQHLGWR